MRLLVHVAGESDLLLISRAPLEERAQWVARRQRDLVAALAGPDGPGAARRMLIEGTWQDDALGTPPPSPLLGAVAALDSTPDLAVVVLGTSQVPPRPLDTLPTARTLVDVLNAVAAHDDSYPVRKATAVAVPGMTEQSVVDALTPHLGEAPPYRQALVTWGSGPTTLALGALTALSRAGLPWQLVLTSASEETPPTYEVVDPLDRLDVDPVAGVFVRWRMFAALDELARTDPPVVQLTDAQRDLVRRAARRNQAGFEARDSASLRAVLADAVVRRDGSASLAVRRYITRRYEELLDIDRATHPGAEDLLRLAERQIRIENIEHRGKRRRRPTTLGSLLGWIGEHRGRDLAVQASIGLPSYKWLYTPEVNSLQNIGRGSHNLRPPGPRDSKIIGDYLSGYETDGTGWRDAGLPEPPVTPADTVLAVWLAGVQPKPAVGTVGQQLSGCLPTVVSKHLGVEETRIRAVIFAVDDGQGSRELADADAKLIGGVTHESTGEPRGEAWVEPIEIPGIDPAAVERVVESRLARETGALLLIPTGTKPVVFALLRAMRRIGARHGIPLFVRENADLDFTNVHLWPALTGGDLPLLNAAKGALRALELDVAWRLLAASAIDPAVTDEARRLADTFASRGPLRDTASVSDQASWTTGLIAQRLEMVDAALAYAKEPADQSRLLVLAADAMEASIAATQTCGGPGQKYGACKGKLHTEARRHETSTAVPARILLLLNEARHRAPITHGTSTDPDAVVADAADRLAEKHSWTDVATLPRDVSTLLRRAVAAAAQRGLGQPDREDSLLRLLKKIIDDIDGAIDQRGSRSAAQSVHGS